MILELINGKDSIDFDGQEICCPTYTYELAEQIMIMLQQDCKGIFHAVNEGPMSWFEFAQEIISQIGASTEIQFKPRVPDTSNTNQDQQFQPLKRPYYTALECQKLKNMGLYRMNSCKGALSRFLSERIIPNT
jgi:dTDP-4-dehydrorhamnose reductase